MFFHLKHRFMGHIGNLCDLIHQLKRYWKLKTQEMKQKTREFYILFHHNPLPDPAAASTSKGSIKGT